MFEESESETPHGRDSFRSNTYGKGQPSQRWAVWSTPPRLFLNYYLDERKLFYPFTPWAWQTLLLLSHSAALGSKSLRLSLSLFFSWETTIGAPSCKPTCSSFSLSPSLEKPHAFSPLWFLPLWSFFLLFLVLLLPLPLFLIPLLSFPSFCLR